MEPTVVADLACEVGENPLWHPEEKCLYWTDIPAARLHRYTPASGRVESFDTGLPVGGFTLQSDGALLLFMARGAVRVWRHGRFVGTVIAELPGELDSRFNDVIADPGGRVFGGTMSTPTRGGKLYRLDRDGAITPLLDGIGTSNGMGFTPDRRRFFHTDTPRREIRAFDFEPATGAIRTPRVFIRTPETPEEGRPDGMTVDADGHLWSARWDGGCLVRYSPSGDEELRVRFPARKVSSLTFGGEDLMDIYVTTAGGRNRPADGAHAGALFRLNLGIRGLPEYRSCVAVRTA